MKIQPMQKLPPVQSYNGGNLVRMYVSDQLKFTECETPHHGDGDSFPHVEMQLALGETIWVKANQDYGHSSGREGRGKVVIDTIQDRYHKYQVYLRVKPGVMFVSTVDVSILLKSHSVTPVLLSMMSIV